MKFVLTLLAWALSSTVALGQAKTIKNTTPGGTIEFWTTPSSTPVKQGSFDANGQFNALQGIAVTGALTVGGNAVQAGVTPAINYVKYPNSKGGTWADSGTGTTSSTESATSNLPRGSIYATGVKIAVGASGSGSTIYQLPLDNNGLNKVLAVSFAQKNGSSFTSTDLQFSVFGCTSAYSGCTRIALSTDVTNVTYVLAGATDFNATFVTSSAAPYLQLQWTRSGGTGDANDWLTLNDVVVGPGQLVQGAAIGSPTYFNPAINGVVMSTQTSVYTRYGKWALVQYEGVASNDSTDTVTFDVTSLFSGATIDTSVWTGVSRQNPGSATMLGSTNSYALVPTWAGTGGVFHFRINGTGNVLDGSHPTAEGGLKTGNRLSFSFWVPISGWSSTVYLSPEGVEFASNSDADAANATNTTSFVQGSQGSLGITGTPSGNSISRNVTFLSPIQPNDLITLEVSGDRINWTQLPTNNVGSGTSFLETLNVAGSSIAGAGITNTKVNANTIQVSFGKYRDADNDTWAGLANWYWRVRKASSGALAGFNLASATTPGLVSGYEETTAVWYDGATSANFRLNSSTGTVAVTVSAVRVGKMVTLRITPFTLTPNGSDYYGYSLNVLATRFRPADDLMFAIPMTSDGGTIQTTPGVFAATSAGNLSFYRNSTQQAWSNTGTAGFTRGFAITYPTN